MLHVVVAVDLAGVQCWNPAKLTVLLLCDPCSRKSCSKTAVGQELTVCGVQEGVPVEDAVTAG